MDFDAFDRLVPAVARHITRRRSLSVLGVLGTAGLWRDGDADAKKKGKKRPRKCFMVGYAFCVGGHTVHVNSCRRKKLLKRGKTPGPCPENCVPQCTDCAGGDDGCGGTCSCPDGQACVDAICQDPQ